MHSPVEPEYKRSVTDFFSDVSVVSISTFRLSEVEFPSVAAIVILLGRAFSHFGFRTLRAMMGRWAGAVPRAKTELGVFSDFCTSDAMVSGSHIFASTSKRLHEDNEGVLFTRRLVQNPLGLFLLLPWEDLLPLPCLF